MRAFRISRHGGPEALEWTELPTPEPGPTEVRVRVRACALNRLDLWVRDGVPGHQFPLPLVPGSEIAGEIDAVGAGAGDHEIGTPVLLAPGVSCGHCDRCIGAEDMLCESYGILGEHRDGGYAEYVVAPARNVLPLPAGLSFAQAAALPLVFMTAWHMLVTRARLRPLEDVLVHAAGSGVSSAGLQIAKLLGARHVIATAGSDAKLEKATRLGATHTVNYREHDFVAAVREITGRKGVEVVFDHVGGDTFEKSLKVLARGGRLVFCGATAAAAAEVNLRMLFFKNQSILGSTMGSLAELRHLLKFVVSGALEPVIDRTLPLAQAPAAQAALESREQFGKIVLIVD
ncbi:MAG: zinc-binding dehydrogenase [Acidobacteriota bacterium]|nr:zinc-binding dehydrogenase [Acidobacteriota bacterium]